MLSTMAHRRAAQRGLSLVEMMVGIAVGLVVVAGAALLVSSQLGENRRLLIETQLQQDMRASMDIITRELRRVGTLLEPVALLGLASPAGSQDNEMARLSPTTSGAGVNTLEFRYQPPLPPYTFGFRRDSDGVVRSKLGSAWQELTDPNVLNVTAFTITPTHSSSMKLPCPRLCDNGTPTDPTDDHTNCWPTVVVREINVSMTANARSDPTVQRTLTGNVRLRNDVVRYANPPFDICPS